MTRTIANACARWAAAAVIAAVAGCASYWQHQREREAQRAQREAAVRDARAACYEGVGRDDLAAAVYDALVGRRYEVATALRGRVTTQWLEETSQRSKVEVQVEDGLRETCKVATIRVSAETRDPSKNEWVAAPDLAHQIEDDIYLDVHTRAQQLAAKAPTTAGAPSPPTAQGSEGGACYGNGTCNQGLTCASGVCVREAGAAASP